MKKLFIVALSISFMLGGLVLIAPKKSTPELGTSFPSLSSPTPQANVSTTTNRPSYDPAPYIDQVRTISRTVNFYNWSQANGEYQQLANLCQQIATNYPNLSEAVNNCTTGVSLVIAGSGCSVDCDTDHNRHAYGPTVDKGLRLMDKASAALSHTN